jgi:hypothetical protein
MSSTTIHSAISQPRPALKQYHQLISLWFELPVGMVSAPGVVG